MTTGPGEPHCFERIAGETTNYAEVTFDFIDHRGRFLMVPFAKMLSAWTGQKSSCGPLQHISEPSTVSLEQEVEHLIRVGLSPSLELIFFRLSMALNRILERCHLATLESPSTLLPWERAHRILLEDYARTISVTELAGRIGVHPDYLTRRFRKAYGVGPLAFQNRMRIEAAKIWLISTDYTLKEIADRVGYEDPGYFARIFRQQIKIAPGRFRRIKQSKESPFPPS